MFVPGLCEDDDAAHVSLSNNRLSLGPRNGPPTVDRPLAGQAMGALECVVFGSAEVALVRCQKANLGEVWRELFVDDSLLLRDAGDHDQHAWWRDSGEDFREWEPVRKSKFYGAFVLNHRVVLHAIDATPVHPTHWLISTQAGAVLRSRCIHSPELYGGGSGGGADRAALDGESRRMGRVPTALGVYL